MPAPIECHREMVGMRVIPRKVFMKRMKPVLEDGTLFRGSRPLDYHDLVGLSAVGVNHIISLEKGWSGLFHWDYERLWRVYGGERTELPTSGNVIFPPTLGQCEAFVKRVQELHAIDKKIFVHCYSGVDRTGFLIAYYMAKVHGVPPGWSWKEYALESGMHCHYQHWRKRFMLYFNEVQ